MFYGTPLQSEEAESKRAHEFQKRDVKDAGTVKALPVWQQVGLRSQTTYKPTVLPSRAAMLLQHACRWPADLP